MPTAGTGPHAQIVAALQAQVAALKITLDGNPVPVEVRKQFKPEDGFPVVPVWVITVERSGGSERLFANTHLTPYAAMLALVASGRADFAASPDNDLTGELGAYLDVQAIVAAILTEPQRLGLAFAWHVEVDRHHPVDPGFAELGYDVGSLGVRVTALEDH